MRAKPSGTDRFKMKWTDDDAVKKSWTDSIPPELWDELFALLNFSSEYPKGTLTAVRHVTYSQHFNRLAEMIRISKKSCFRTDTEVFRVAIHHGMGLLYNVFCNKKNEHKNTRSHFFYAALQDLEKKMERATMVSVINDKIAGLTECVNKREMTKEEAQENLNVLLNTLPEDDKEYFRVFFRKPNKDNVRSIGEELMKNFTMLE